jgi:carbon storage regulator CsrA
MLVIARKAGQALRIGRNVKVEVREIRNNQVKLSISAPPEVAILRTEIGIDPRPEGVSNPVVEEAERGCGRPDGD